jgi:hypothetical protein
MWIKTDKGRTECHIESIAAIEPAVLKVREGYRQACIDKPAEKDKHAEKVIIWCGQRFGPSRFNKDFESVCGRGVETKSGWAYGGSEGIRKWDEFIASKPPEYRRWYITPEVIAGCIMGEDE